MVSRRVGVGLVGAWVFACTSPQDLDWRIQLPSPSDLGADVAAVELRIHAGTCADGGGDASSTYRRTVYAAQVPRPADAPRPPDLDPGPYALSAVARDAGCTVIAAGCIDAMLPATAEEPVVTALTPTSAPACRLCEAGRCDTSLGPTHAWSRSAGGSFPDEGWSVAIGPADGVYVTGRFRSGHHFEGGAFGDDGNDEALVSAFRSNGAHRWSRRLGEGTTNDWGRAVAVGGDSVWVGGSGCASGNRALLVAGQSTGDFEVEPGRCDRLDGVGTVHDTVTDSRGSVYITGQHGGLLAGELPASELDVFVARLATDGTVRWLRSFGGGGDDKGQAVALSVDERTLYVTGSFEGPITLGTQGYCPGSDCAANASDAFLVAMDVDDVPGDGILWATAGGGEGSDTGRALAVQDAGRLWWAGTFENDLQLGGASFTRDELGEARNAFLALVDTRDNPGDILAAMPLAGDAIHSIGTAARGEVAYFAGVRGTDAEGRALVGSVSIDREAGELRIPWTQTYAGPSSAADLAIDSRGALRVTGRFTGTVDFGGGPLISAGLADVFVLAFNP